MSQKESDQVNKPNNAGKKETKNKNWIKPTIQGLVTLIGLGGFAKVLAFVVSAQQSGVEMTTQLFLSSLTEWDFIFYPCSIVIILVYVDFLLIKYIYNTKETKNNCRKTLAFLSIILINLPLLFLSALAATNIFQNDFLPLITQTSTPYSIITPTQMDSHEEDQIIITFLSNFNKETEKRLRDVNEILEGIFPLYFCEPYEEKVKPFKNYLHDEFYERYMENPRGVNITCGLDFDDYDYYDRGTFWDVIILNVCEMNRDGEIPKTEIYEFNISIKKESEYIESLCISKFEYKKQ